MTEHEKGPGITYKNAPSTVFLRRIVPLPVSIAIADKFLGQRLTPQGREHLKPILAKILKGEHISVGKEVLPIYQDSDYKFETVGQEHIPTSGTTLFIGNHEKSPLIGGMGHFIEAARAAYEMRSAVLDEATREPKVIFQRGLTRLIKLPGGKKLYWMIPLTEQFYQLAAESLDWVVVDPPKHDKNNQITNKQNLPHGTVDRFLENQALFWFPQGKNEGEGDMVMPQKGSDFITSLKDNDITVVPVRFKRRRAAFHVGFSPSIHIQDFPQTEDGKLDLNKYAQEHLQND